MSENDYLLIVLNTITGLLDLYDYFNRCIY